MASNILAKATETVQSAMPGEQNAKFAQMAPDTRDGQDPKARITSDWGTKQTNTDHWLSASTNDQYGPSLLEDVFAREKVSGIYI
jgi:catalase